MTYLDRFILILFLALSSGIYAQYTETINSNRPGESQGAYSVGPSVVQLETGVDFGNDTHELLNTDTDIFGANAVIRYGFWLEELEVNANIRYQFDQINFTTGSAGSDTRAGLETVQLGAKYLVYDPYKYGVEREVNLYSYHANKKFNWKTLIPAVSAYAGAVLDFTNSEFNTVRDDGLSPNIAIITQHNWGRWVWVNNLVLDRLGSNFSSTQWISTLTHSFSPKLAGFGEYQLVNGDFYSDFLFRGGAAYLLTDNFQIDAGGLVNLKDTPSRWNVAIGLSYRLDFHKKDQKIEDTNDKKESSSKKQAKRAKKKDRKKRRDAVEPDGDGGDNDNI